MTHHEVSRDWTPVSAKDNANIPAVSYREGMGVRGACRMVTSALRLPSKPTVATTVHSTPRTGEVWSGAVERSRRGHAPERHIVVKCDDDDMHTRNRANEYRVRPPTSKNWSELFRWYEQFQGTCMSPRVYPTPEQRDMLRVALEGAPYVVKVGNRVTGMFAKREQAEHVVTRMGVRAALYHVGARYAWVEGATQVLPRSDRARGPSAVLAGQGTKTVRHKVVIGFDEQRIDPNAAHRFDYDAKRDALIPHSSMNGAELERAKFEAEKRWTRDRAIPSANYDRAATACMVKRDRAPASVARLAPSGSEDPKHPWAGVDKPVARRMCRAS